MNRTHPTVRSLKQHMTVTKLTSTEFPGRPNHNDY